MALWFPYLPVERLLRARMGRSWRSAAAHERQPPLVVSRLEKNARHIAALDEKAEALGLRRGMGVADARAMHPAIEVAEADEAADRRLLEGVADWCDRYTPLVALCGAAGLFLDITGCAHLFGGEQAMLDDVTARLSAQGFLARVGLASTPGMAWAAARFLGRTPIAPGAEREALAPLPLAALRLDAAIRIKLESVGLRDVGALMARPRAPFARRFGASLMLRIDQALGRLEEPVSPRLPVPPLVVERHLADPVTLNDDIERLVFLLSQTLKADLERRGEGARRLQLILFRVDGAVSRLDIGAARPLREPALIRRLFREKLAALEGSIDAGYGFDLVRLAVLAAARFDEAQDDFAGTRTQAEEELALFVDRLRARLGEHAILQPVMIESHIPERAAMLVPFAGDENRTGQRTPAIMQPERPVRLFAAPEPVEVMAEIPEGPPMSFRWRRTVCRVTGAEGPERIAPEWWHGTDESPPRDYYRIEDEGGRRYWLYREGFYGNPEAPPRWFMQGLFA